MKVKILGILVLLAISFQLFQNCSAVMAPQDDSKSSKAPATTLSTPSDHPNAQIIQPTEQMPVIANRVYINELLKEVFESPGSGTTAAAISNFWIENYSGIFGFPCNPKGKNGLSDCGGTTLAPMSPKPDTLRASHKSQVCLALTSNNLLLLNALNKIENRAALPDQASVDQLIQLFYRGEDNVSELSNQLLQVDREIKTNDQTISDIDRWRLLTSMICESPGWEIL